jgi:ABC-2 type transport system permease protein
VTSAYVAEARYEAVRAFRAPGFAIPTLLLPVMLYAFFGVLMAQDDWTPQIALFIFVGFSVFGVMGPGLIGFGVFVASERDQGLITLKRALPMPPLAYLLAKICMALVFATLVLVTMAVAALAAGKVTLAPPRLVAVLATVALGAPAFCAIGLFVGTLASGRSAPAIVNLIYLPMTYLSGFLIPLPAAIRPVQFLSPAFHLDQLALRVAGAPTETMPLVSVGVLVGVTVVLTALAVSRLAKEQT